MLSLNATAKTQRAVLAAPYLNRDATVGNVMAVQLPIPGT